uniref:C2H2-type domain-containing protein n=1 Tax=Leersia perrieri TaxID=77586 RepID=A0A0D9XVN6_9ORYZ
MEVATNSTNNSTRSPVKLMLVLTLSPASKVIGKGGGGGGNCRRVQLDHGGEFQCRTCGRRFATFQALGGHRTSHKRPRVRADGLDLLLGARPGKIAGAAASSAVAVHRCDMCGKVFATGQALGGHMRRHRPLMGTTTATMSGSSSTTSEEERRRRGATATESKAAAAAFECRTCGRRFTSHQALGGHRTSHLRPTRIKGRPSLSRPVVHECEVCGMGFEMGQALGGHMRRHRPSNVEMGLKKIVVQEIRPSFTHQLLDLFI